MNREKFLAGQKATAAAADPMVLLREAKAIGTASWRSYAASRSPLAAAEKAEVAAIVKNETAKARKKVRAAKATDWFAIWRDACHAAFPAMTVPVWFGRDIGLAKNLQRKVGDRFIPFLEFAVRRWGRVIETSLAWMKNPPSQPSISFLYQRTPFDAFMVAFDAEINNPKLYALPDDGAYHRLRARGRTEEEAYAEISERQAYRQFVKNFEKREADVNARGRAVSAEKLQFEEQKRRDIILSANLSGKISVDTPRRRVLPIQNSKVDKIKLRDWDEGKK